MTVYFDSYPAYIVEQGQNLSPPPPVIIRTPSDTYNGRKELNIFKGNLTDYVINAIFDMDFLT